MKLLIMAFMWMPLDTNHLPRTPLEILQTPQGTSTPWWHWFCQHKIRYFFISPTMRTFEKMTMCANTPQKLLRKCDLKKCHCGFTIPQIQIRCASKITIHGSNLALTCWDIDTGPLGVYQSCLAPGWWHWIFWVLWVVSWGSRDCTSSSVPNRSRIWGIWRPGLNPWAFYQCSTITLHPGDHDHFVVLLTWGGLLCFKQCLGGFMGKITSTQLSGCQDSHGL